MQITTKEVRDGLHDNQVVWICHYNRPDMHKKPLRNVSPTRCLVRPNSELRTNKKVYYSASHFAPLKADSTTYAKVISPVDNTGYRMHCGNELYVFDTEIECVAEWQKQIDEHVKVIDAIILNVKDAWQQEKDDLIKIK